MQLEQYVEWIDRTPITRPYQNIIMIGILFDQAIDIERILKEQGGKLNNHALLVMKEEISQLHFDIKTLRAGVEN